MHMNEFGSRLIGDDLGSMNISDSESWRYHIVKAVYHGACHDSWDAIIAKYARHIYEQRLKVSVEGDETSDWYKGIEMYYSDLCDYIAKDAAQSFDRDIIATIKEIQRSNRESEL